MKPTTSTHLVLTFALLTCLSTLSPQLSASSMGTAFTYQGRLAENGNSVNGSYDLQFTLYDAVTNGSVRAGPVTNVAVAVTNGLFTTTLDFGADVFDGAAGWLEIGVRAGTNAFTTLSPRQPVTPAPYALYASSAGVATNATGVATNTIMSWAIATNQVVKSLNGLRDDVTLAAGSNITITNDDNTITIAAVGGGGGGTSWELTGNAAAPGNFLGTINNTPLEFRVMGQRALKLELTAFSPNVIGGFNGNNAGAAVGATIGGGGESNNINRVSADFGTIGGGEGNDVLSQEATIGGGFQNTIANNSDYAVIAGGQENWINGASANSFIGGGWQNYITNAWNATLSGGERNNILNSTKGTIAGGSHHVISNSVGSVIAGGNANLIVNSEYASIAGGTDNRAFGVYAAMGGGGYNRATGGFATVPGGSNNFAAGSCSLAVGQNAKAMHNGTFVWADSQAGDFWSTNSDTFIIRATNGVAINKNSPAAALDVNGDVIALAFYGNGAGITNLQADNADRLDTLHANSFLRGDTNTTYTSGTLTINSNTTLDVQGTLRLGASVAKTGAGLVTNFNADLLDGLHTNSFLRSDASNTFTSGTLTIGNSATLDVDGTLRMDGAVVKTGTDLVTNLNADLLDGSHSGSFLRSDTSGVFTSGTLTVSNGATLDVQGTLRLGAEVVKTGANLVTNLNADLLDGYDAVYLMGSGGSNAWSLNGNLNTIAGTNFLGTKDNQALELKVNNARALRLEPNTNGAPNVIGGAPVNEVAAGVAAATISGGGAMNWNGVAYTNRVAATGGTVSGGLQNEIQTGSLYGTLGGGIMNTILANSGMGTIGGGNQNIIGISVGYATIAGGYINSNAAWYGTIGGGGQNVLGANANYATVGGGGGNSIGTASGYSAIGGGWNNIISNCNMYGACFIGGGEQNRVGSFAGYSTIPGGRANYVGGVYGFAAGRNAKAINDGSFVWADSQSTDFASSAANQFLIRAAGGVGINKNNPATALDVWGAITASGAVTAGSLGASGSATVGSLGIGITNPSVDLCIYSPGAAIQLCNSNSGVGYGNGIQISYYSGNSLDGALWNHEAGCLAFGTSGTDRMRITADGLVGIGTTAPGYMLEVNGSAGKPGGGSWTSTSDQRLKKNIRSLSGVLEKLLALRGVSFEYKEPEKIHERTGERLGMVAQEVEPIFPDWVETGSDGYKRLTYRGFEALTVEALRELREEKETRIAALETEVDELKARLEKLEQLLSARNGGRQ
jgi:hypothetical protein